MTLIDRRNHHLFQPLLYQVRDRHPARRARSRRPCGTSCARTTNVHVELAEVTGFDLDRRVVHGEATSRTSRSRFPYDSLIVAAGAAQSYFGHDEFALYVPGMKTLDDALEFRRRIFGAFEMAETGTDPRASSGAG